MIKSVLKVNDISAFTPSNKLILDHINFELYSRLCYGLIGSNGCGKTTLLNILNDTTNLAYSGEINISPLLRISHLKQNIDNSINNLTVKELLLNQYLIYKQKLEEIENKLTYNGNKNISSLLDKYQSYLDKFNIIGGENYVIEVYKAINTIGYQDKMNTNIDSLSGGERKLIYILKIILENPDVLLLDEPDVSLDTENIILLEKLISRYNNTILLVSHNRMLLDSCCDHILILENHKITEYNGNYSYFKYVQLSNKVAQQRNSYYDKKKIAAQKKIEKLYSEIASKSSDPSWGRKLRSRRKIVEKLEKDATIPPYVYIKKIFFEFRDSNYKKDIVIKITNFNKKYDKQILFKDANMLIMNGEKVALWGKNGSGKTTLLREIINNQNTNDFIFEFDRSLKIGYLPQINEKLHLNETIFDNFIRLGVTDIEKIYKLLKPFLFSKEDIYKKIGLFSGGELKFIELALLSYGVYDFLILDEPTNNLDIFSQEALENAIRKYNGSVLLVSHDIYFLENTVDYIYVLENEKLSKYDLKNFKEKIFSNVYDKDTFNFLEDLKKKKRLLEKEIDIALYNEEYKICRQLILDLSDIVGQIKKFQKIH